MASPSWSPSSGGEQQPRTASSIVARAVPVSGSHDLKIDGYSGTKGIGNSNFIASDAFVVGGRRWHLHYYPDGFYGYPEWISFYLRLDPDDDNVVNAQFQISLLGHDDDGNPPVHTKTSKTCAFSKQTGMFGFVQFIRKKELEESAYLEGDVFTIRCDITMSKKVYTETTTAASAMAPPDDVIRHLSQLLSTGDGADVTFQVGEEMIPAHRCILAARSPVFRAELLGPMKEKAGASIRIDGIVEPKVFKAMLHFVYTGSLPHIDVGDAMAMAQHLLVLADRYHLGRLKIICEDILHRYIDTSTVGTTLTLAEQHGCGALKDACLKFLASWGNFKALMTTDGFEHLTRSCPSLLKDLAANLDT